MREISKAIANPNVLAALCLIIAVVVIVRLFLGRYKKPIWPTTIILGLVACTVYLGLMHRPLTNFWKHGNWATFHYFMGSKYFEELEYYRLYRYCLLADVETGLNKAKRVKHVRHLENYKLVPRKKAIALARKEKSKYFTEKRWEEFKRDWIAVNTRAPRANWNRMLTDRGFNPPPFWNTIPGTIAQWVMVEDTFQFMLVRNFDLLFMVVALVLVAIFCGIDIAFIVFCFVNLSDYNRGHQLGTYFQFVWLSSMIASMALYRGGKMKLSGAFMAVSASVRMFPVYLAVGVGVVWLRKLILTKKLPKKESAFIFTFAICCILFLLVGMTQGKGFHSTKEFFQNITMHADHQKYDSNKFGLTRTMSVPLLSPFAKQGGKPHRIAQHKKNIWVHRVMWVALMSLGLAVMIRKTDDDDWVIPAGMVLLFAMMVISRYYYLALIVFLIPPPSKKVEGAATIAASWLFVTHSFFYLLQDRVISWRATFTAANFGYMALFIAFPVYLLVRQHLKKKQELVPAEEIESTEIL